MTCGRDCFAALAMTARFISGGLGTMGFGMPAAMGAALAAALETSGACLIHVSIDAAEHVFPMVPPGAANREMIAG